MVASLEGLVPKFLKVISNTFMSLVVLFGDCLALWLRGIKM